MDTELNNIKKRKLEEYKEKYLKGGNKSMSNNKENKLIELTDDDLETNVKKHDFFAVDCWAPWCGPCRMFTPIVEELADEMKEDVVFAKLNVDENPKTSAKHQIMSIPTLLVFKNGELIDRLVGVIPKEELKKKLQSY